jgi:hypothetical protein
MPAGGSRRWEILPHNVDWPERDSAVQAALREALELHYTSWMDEKIPALGGKTPRQTIRTAESRRDTPPAGTASERMTLP